MAGPDNCNLIQFRLGAPLVQKLDQHILKDASNTGIISRNTFCKRLVEEALEKLLGSAVPDVEPAPAE